MKYPCIKNLNELKLKIHEYCNYLNEKLHQYQNDTIYAMKK
jgi:hypothetical protein